MPGIYIGGELIANVGGGVDITADSSNRLYLVGSKDLVGSNVETLNTYNATTYFQSGNLYMAGNKVITAADTTKLVGNYSRSSIGYIVLGQIKICWGSFSIAGNSKGSSSFASSFAGTPYSAVCTWDYDYTGGQENYAIYQLSYSTIYIVNGEGSTRTFRYIAIGPA